MKLSAKFHRALVDCSDKAFYREMTKKYELTGLPTLAFFDADGRKIDEIAGYTPDAQAYLKLMTKALGPAPVQDERVEKALQRIDQAIREWSKSVREEILRLVREEIAKSKSQPPSFDAQLDAFADRLKKDDGIHGRLRKILKSKDGKDFVRAAMEQQGIESLEQAIELFFEKDSAGAWVVKPEQEQTLLEWLDEVAPVEPEPEPKKRAYLGITPDDFTDDQRRKLGLEKGHGIKILEVAKGGPAENGGVRAGDIVLTIGGKKVGDENIMTILEASKPGDKVEVVVLRKSEKVKLTLVLGEK